jgi:hypothetical protein
MTREEILWQMGWPSVAAAAVSDLMDRIEATVRAAEKAEREKEREACAKLCDRLAETMDFGTGYYEECAAAIRARGA